MTTLKCINCGCAITIEENAENCVCEACETSWQVSQLVDYKTKAEEITASVIAEMDAFRKRADEEKERKAEEERRKKETEDFVTRKKAETDDYVARKKAEAEVAKAQNTSKTVNNTYNIGGSNNNVTIVNGPDTADLASNAVSAFVNRDFKSALKSSEEILALDASNAVALYINAFNDYVFNKKMRAMDEYFSQLGSVALAIEKDQLEQLEQLFISSRGKIAYYETQILSFVLENSCQDPVNAAAVCKFVDSFSPYLIGMQSNHDFLNSELVAVYKSLSGYCSMPKTCFALLGAIENNPDSPLKNGQYYLRSKNQKFYDDFVKPVGEIIYNMKSPKNRPQFVDAFDKKKQLYCQKTDISD